MKCVSLLSINRTPHRLIHEPLTHHHRSRPQFSTPTRAALRTPSGFTTSPLQRPLAAFTGDQDFPAEDTLDLEEQVEGEEGLEVEASAEDEGELDSSEDYSEVEDREQKDVTDDRDLEERIVSLSRVCKTVKGGRNVRFRAVMVVGDGKGTVGVGNASAKEIVVACRKAKLQAQRNFITIPLSPESATFPHFIEAKFSSAKVMLRPANAGTGVIAGGAVRTVLEVAGVKNGFGKILNSGNAMNIAKATIKGLASMRTVQDVAKDRGVTLDYLLGNTIDLSESALPPELQSDPEMQILS